MFSEDKALVALPINASAIKLIKFWDSWNGRDKTCRAVQYFAKFLAYYYEQQQKHYGLDHKLLIGQYKALSTQLSLARKAFRFCRWINFYDKIVKLLAKKPDINSPKAALIYLSDFVNFLCFAVYLGYDGYVFLGKIGAVLDKTTDQKAKTSNYWWFFALVGAVVGDLVRIYEAKTAESQIDKGDKQNLEAARSALNKLYIQLAKDAADLFVPLSLNNHASWVPGAGWCGILGTVSSLIGAYQAWPEK